MRRTIRGLLVAAVAVLTVAMLAIPSFASGSARMALTDSLPSWANAQNLVGHAPASERVTFLVGLGWHDQAGINRVIDAVTEPNSPSYHHYLTPAEFTTRFAPSAAQVGAVTSWIKASGLQVESTPSDHLFVQASGTVGQIEAAFGTKLNTYRFQGKVLRSPATAPSVPASLKGIVTGVVGLDQTQVGYDHISGQKTDTSASPNQEPPPPALFRNAGPCSGFWGQVVSTKYPPAYGQQPPVTPCGLSPGQVRGAYGLRGLGNSERGQGQTVAIIDAFASPTIVSDTNQWSANRNLPAPNIQQTVFTPDQPIDNGWWGEETLDVQAVHGLAPAATIQYIGAADAGQGITFAQNYVVENHVASIVSNSYGYDGEQLPESIIRMEQRIFSMGAATGVGFYFSSGDSGDETLSLGYRTVDWPASSTYVTAVGGTSLGVTPGSGYNFETYWGTFKSTLTDGAWQPDPPGAWIYGGGGGTSRIMTEPSWQQGVVPTQFSGYWGGSNRVVPDISADADPNTGYEIGQTQSAPGGGTGYSEYRIGGTSLACPLMAGMMALADQYAGFEHGFVNPALYAAYATTPDMVRDVTAPSATVAMVRNDYVNGINRKDGIITSLRTTGQTLTLSSVPGFDDSTGMGSPNGLNFLNALAGGS